MARAPSTSPEIKVRGLASRADAKAAAKTIATSMLVKTALFGEDANWGRLVGSRRSRGRRRSTRSRAAIAIGGVAIVKDGAPIGAEAEKRANEFLKQLLLRPSGAHTRRWPGRVPLPDERFGPRLRRRQRRLSILRRR